MNITFIPLGCDHFPLLVQWLNSEHVKAWWDQGIIWNLELIQQKYHSYTQGYKWEGGIKKPIHGYIICVGRQKVGYIQYYNAYDFPRECSLVGLPRSLAALDMFIGEENHIGRGFGAQIIRSFLNEYVDPYFSACLVDPDRGNTQAIRAYEKAGFQKVREHQDKKIVLMIRKAEEKAS